MAWLHHLPPPRRPPPTIIYDGRQLLRVRVYWARAYIWPALSHLWPLTMLPRGRRPSSMGYVPSSETLPRTCRGH